VAKDAWTKASLQSAIVLPIHEVILECPPLNFVRKSEEIPEYVPIADYQRLDMARILLCIITGDESSKKTPMFEKVYQI
jgi:hypothetical protein